jgi:hypothetical protein
MRQAESEMNSAENGFTKLMRKVVPGLGHPSAKQPSLETNTIESAGESI